MYNLLWCEEDNDNDVLFTCNTIREMRVVVRQYLSSFRKQGFVVRSKIKPQDLPARVSTPLFASARLRGDAFFRFSLEYRPQKTKK